MELLLTLWAELPINTQTLLADTGLVAIILLLSISIKNNAQQKLTDWGIDQVLIMPRIEKTSSKPNNRLSTLLSWLFAISLGVIAFEYFVEGFNLFTEKKYLTLFINGWISVACYIAILALIRVFTLALIKFLTHTNIKKKIQNYFSDDESTQYRQTKEQDISTVLVDSIGVVIYSTSALLIGFLFIIDIFKLKIFGVVPLLTEMLINTGLAAIILLLSISLKKNVQQQLTDWGIDQILIMPSIEKTAGEPSNRLSTLLSWLCVISVAVLGFEFFIEDFNLFTEKRYLTLFINGWVLIACYIAILTLIRVFTQALIKLLAHSKIKKKIQDYFNDDESTQYHETKEQDIATVLVDSIGVAIYSTSALLIGFLFIIDILKLKIFGGLIVALLSGIGQLFIALVMIAVGIVSFRHFWKMNTESSEKSMIALPAIAFSGAIILAITILRPDSGSLFAPLFWLLLIALIALFFSDQLRANIPDVLAGLYMRLSNYHNAMLKSELSGSHLIQFGWTSSIIENDSHESKTISNRDILDAGIEKIKV